MTTHRAALAHRHPGLGGHHGARPRGRAPASTAPLFGWEFEVRRPERGGVHAGARRRSARRRAGRAQGSARRAAARVVRVPGDRRPRPRPPPRSSAAGGPDDRGARCRSRASARWRSVADAAGAVFGLWQPGHAHRLGRGRGARRPWSGPRSWCTTSPARSRSTSDVFGLGAEDLSAPGFDVRARCRSATRPVAGVGAYGEAAARRSRRLDAVLRASRTPTRRPRSSPARRDGGQPADRHAVRADGDRRPARSARCSRSWGQSLGS